MRLLLLAVAFNVQCSVFNVYAQISIGGNIYGGGNAGDTGGSTNVTILSGDLNEVYGGARMADVKGNAYVNIDGKHASDSIVINKVYGGNDISGIIGDSLAAHALPASLEQATDNGVNSSWDAFVHISTKTDDTGEESDDAVKIYIGQLFGGGNGDYDYASDGSPYKGMTKPVLGKTYLEILGGSIVYAYGGGNAATVTGSTVICVDNPSEVVNSILDKGGNELLTNDRFEKKMGINTSYSYPSSDAYQIGRLFGGNNKAEMAIRPVWKLKNGKVRNLYSGGNAGPMTSETGILLILNHPGMKIDNVYGGCRMADVNPDNYAIAAEHDKVDEGKPTELEYSFPAGFSAKLYISAGDINNVYGGNDITGNVRGGNAVGIHSKINGNVYGGGNGSYPYTDNPNLKDEYKQVYEDFYYNPDDVLTKAGVTATSEKLKSAEALNLFRPNAEQVSVRVVGTESDPTIIHGAVYCGGNSATLMSASENAKVELKIGSYAYIDNVFLGNNGENMVKNTATNDVLQIMASTDKTKDGTKFCTIDLTDSIVFAKYMEGAAIKKMPSVKFDGDDETDLVKYEDYKSYIGSFYCGGNVGSSIRAGKTTINFKHKIIVYDKVVGGCNNANIEAKVGVNAAYEGGMLGATDVNGNKVELNFEGLKIQPKRWDATYTPVANNENLVVGNQYYTTALGDGEFTATTTEKEAGKTYYKITDLGSELVWNTISAASGLRVSPGALSTGNSTDDDLDRRLYGGNVYGGCYNTGHVNGNVVINVDSAIVDRKGEFAIFDEIEENEGEAILYGKDSYNITKRLSGVILDEQGMDALGLSLNVFGGGYGTESEIWGSTTININSGYVFQVFGGGQQGAIGKKVKKTRPKAGGEEGETEEYEEYDYNPDYSCYINLKGKYPGTYRGDKLLDNNNNDGVVDNDDMAEAEFIYGGAFKGLIAGNVVINLGDGRIFNSFAGSCDADILGHTETYVGRQPKDDGKGYRDGFPWIRDHIYGGNDLGGEIKNLGDASFKSRVNTDILDKVYGYSSTDDDADVFHAAAYTEYLQGRVDYIFAGCYGDYDYDNNASRYYKPDVSTQPRMNNAFVNFRPNNLARNTVKRIYGAGQGMSMQPGKDLMQNRSYILIDDKYDQDFSTMEVFGAGARCGLGMGVTPTDLIDHKVGENDVKGQPDKASAIIDLVRGQVKDVYGASFEEGVTRRTVVNVPASSTIKAKRIFGGGFGMSNARPCDTYEANVNYNSSEALVGGYHEGIYGGNNNCRRTLYSIVNIYSPVFYDKANDYVATVYGAGYGKDTWSQYTEVNLKANPDNTKTGARVYEVYGGGNNGMVLNKQSVDAWKKFTYQVEENNAMVTKEADVYKTIGDGYTDIGLDDPLVKPNRLGLKTNTNVNIDTCASVSGYIYNGSLSGAYAYGGGRGADATVSGTTYIGVHGGTVVKDVYAAGWGGDVQDKFKVAKDADDSNDFVATTNAFIEGGTVRNVYGGGYQGHVGYHEGELNASTTNDIEGRTNVVIGIRKDQATLPSDYGFYKGLPAVERNAYGGGEGGSVFGHANLTINNGYIGYRFFAEEPEDNSFETIVDGGGYYQEKRDDETWSVPAEQKNRLKDCGNAFGGGYDDKSTCDNTHITIWGGTVRSSVYGGGEIATVGRGKTKNLTGLDREVESITKYGQTHIEMYNGLVQRNVFGGGKGYNILGYGGTNELYTDGYVFGQTEVHIHGGEVGTDEGLAEGYGNVFGGGDVGFVYGNGFLNSASGKEGTTSPNHFYYYTGNENEYVCTKDYDSYVIGSKIDKTTYDALTAANKDNWRKNIELTEDCKVVVSPYLQVKSDVTDSIEYDGKKYGPYDYVPTDYLNTLPSKNMTTKQYGGDWIKLYTGAKDIDGNIDPSDPVERGVIIHNGVFGGGNVSSNSDKTYANATTVFGNTTATLYDVYHRDFISVGTEHTGGIYGGGNLSIVGGYRELNITNYGTDYYGQNEQITLDEYRKLSNRERAYFQLKYLCKQACTDKNGKEYSVGEKITEEDYKNLFATTDYYNEDYWEQWGFCSIYAGRLLNTIQRADFCGVYGSRMVLQGAKDRVADVGDNTVYTINRMGELSLNLQHSVIKEDLALKEGKARATNVSDQDPDDYVDYEKAVHGNYFGIYSVVNYLGNLTSDVHFDDKYRIWNKATEKGTDVPGETYEHWKVSHMDKPGERNKGVSFNQVALASGVFLELTTENSTKTKKDYGYVTGIVELDLINVKKDIEGGGYVYAKNQHGERTEHLDYHNVVLSEYNKAKTVGSIEYRDEARTYKRYTYSDDVSKLKDYQTSGNFIHKKKRIVDDCYPNNGVYNDGYVKSPAHYWYIKGDVYIYDQLISAYAGSATAYHKEVKIPLTITAGSNGKLKLLNVQPNLYAYYGDKEMTSKIGEDGVKLDDESATYHLNDVITWWDWNQLSPGEQKYFVKDTYVNVDTCTVAGVLYPEGTYVMLPSDSTTFKTDYINTNKVVDKKGNTITKFHELFHPSNNISHYNGYVLTFDMDSPGDWDDWYSPINGPSTYTVASDGTVTTSRMKRKDYDPDKDSETYRVGPTFTLKTDMPAGLYGQRDYTVGEIISKEVYTDYTTTTNGKDQTNWPTQAQVDGAYVAKTDCEVGTTFVQEGHAISKETYNTLSSGLKENFDEALVCVNTLRVGEEEYVLMGELVGKTTLDDLATRYKNYNNSLTNIDTITQEEALKEVKEHLSDAYYVTSDGKYGGQYFESGINYSALKAWCSLPDDRGKFAFNQDAFDVLYDQTFSGNTSVYARPYCDEKPVDYTAYYSGGLGFTYKDTSGVAHIINTEEERTLSRDAFEQVMNEQQYFTRLSVPSGGADFYIVKENFFDSGTPFAKGQDISATDYSNLSVANKGKVQYPVHVDNSEPNTVTKYYCYEAGGLKAVGDTINVDTYSNLKNYQKYFTVQGAEPTETTTLYVAQESSAKDVTSEKVITVVYQYTYYEEDEGDNEDGTTSNEEGICLKNELHVVNIRLKLESGVPEIGPLSAPPTILPGKKFGLKAPSVNPGLYEVISNGWEMYTDETDAELHRNGMSFVNNNTPVYWYQNKKAWVAFYSRTYLGKSYSNSVPLTIANYHDLDAVMKDTLHHLHVDHPDVMRNSKIYIDNRSCESDASKSELDLLKDFYDLSLIERAEGVTTEDTITKTGHPFKGHTLLNPRVKGGAKLEFILNSNVSPKAYTVSGGSPAGWTPIGDDTQCFEGNLHGDGYTVSGLDKSLFGKLCGNVYNLGVTGSFTTSGVADAGGGRVENCWINTSATTGFSGTKAVFGSDEGTLVNSYYPVTKVYEATNGATPMTEREFYNGTVAYNLNGFYLNKRYYDGSTSWTGDKVTYQYFKTTPGADMPNEMISGQYPSTYAIYPLKEGEEKKYGYVENRFSNEDFTYAAGSIPEASDIRMRSTTTTDNNVATTTITYAPIYPDDYIFFGQRLTYDTKEGTHQDWPVHIGKSESRMDVSPQSSGSNRVLRAPAYFRSGTMSVAHFNVNAVIPAKSKPVSPTDTNLRDAYPGMTAIDFAGHNDGTWTNEATVPTGSPAGATALFYQPLLDDDGLGSININGQTPNLLVYAPAETPLVEKGYANTKTYNVLNHQNTGFVNEPQFSDHNEESSAYNDGRKYNRVAKADASKVKAHLVQTTLTNNLVTATATNDHLLVDKQEFYCPIPYTFDSDNRMWYQRTPDNYVDRQSGWETISLPFQVETVTTDKKGELTHFYQGSAKGHEYWLREYNGKKEETGGVMTAKFESLKQATETDDGDMTKVVNNTFLWDFFYEGFHNQQDDHGDEYQKGYYDYSEDERKCPKYPRMAAGTPYLIGFPGDTYYEFDLSGKFVALTTASAVPDTITVSRQVLTFVSEEGASVDASANETGKSADSYQFTTNYLSQSLTGNNWVLNTKNNDGKSSFDKTPASVTNETPAVSVLPFRPYFTKVTSSTPAPAPKYVISRINIGSDAIFSIDDSDPTEGEPGGLTFFAKPHKLGVTSSLRKAADVRIFSISGLCVGNFTIQPGETVETSIPIAGVYIVRAANGRYHKKLSIR